MSKFYECDSIAVESVLFTDDITLEWSVSGIGKTIKDRLEAAGHWILEKINRLLDAIDSFANDLKDTFMNVDVQNLHLDYNKREQNKLRGWYDSIIKVLTEYRGATVKSETITDRVAYYKDNHYKIITAKRCVMKQWVKDIEHELKYYKNSWEKLSKIDTDIDFDNPEDKQNYSDHIAAWIKLTSDIIGIFTEDVITMRTALRNAGIPSGTKL